MIGGGEWDTGQGPWAIGLTMPPPLFCEVFGVEINSLTLTAVYCERLTSMVSDGKLEKWEVDEFADSDDFSNGRLGPSCNDFYTPSYVPLVINALEKLARGEKYQGRRITMNDDTKAKIDALAKRGFSIECKIDHLIWDKIDPLTDRLFDLMFNNRVARYILRI